LLKIKEIAMKQALEAKFVHFLILFLFIFYVAYLYLQEYFRAREVYEGVSKRFRTKSITKSMLTFGIDR